MITISTLTHYAKATPPCATGMITLNNNRLSSWRLVIRRRPFHIFLVACCLLHLAETKQTEHWMGQAGVESGMKSYARKGSCFLCLQENSWRAVANTHQVLTKVLLFTRYLVNLIHSQGYSILSPAKKRTARPCPVWPRLIHLHTAVA